MSKIVEYLKEVNLNNKEYLENYIWKSTTEELIILIDCLRKLIEEDYVIQKYNPFTFVPNNDLSGAGGCNELSCKVRRATKFAVFSSLYADDVYIQLNFITDAHGEFNIKEIDLDDDSYFNFRYNLLCDISVINTYSKLLEENIIHITPPKNMYCQDCFQKAVLGVENSINIKPIKELLMSKAKFVIDEYDKDNDYLTFRVENIEDFYPDHPEIFRMSKHEVMKVPKYSRKSGTLITNKNIINNFIDSFVDGEFASSCYYASYCKDNKAKFITNKVSDGMFMELTNQKSKSNHGLDSYNAIPKYDLPFVEKITIEKALHLREIEGESFNKYRIALNKSIEEQCKTNSTVEWTEIYDDILYPAFNDLDMKLKSINKGFFRNTFSEIVIFGTVISAGLYTGIIPHNMTDIMKSIGIGTGTSISIAHQMFGKISAKEGLKQNDYYFLWRLKKNIEKEL